MKLEDELYIEAYLCKIIELRVESKYKIDKFGNIVYKDKNEVIEEVRKLVSNPPKELEASEDEIRNYLIHIYEQRIINPEFKKEGTELISILRDTKQECKEIEDKNKGSLKNNRER